MAKLPIRASKEHKSHALRLRTYAKNLPIKAARKAEQKRREEINLARGYTGKDIDNAMRKAYGPEYRQGKRASQRVESISSQVIADVMTR
jgi:hypothetical protein